MTKLDLVKLEPRLYAAPQGRVVTLDVPVERYLTLDGSGSPELPAFSEALRAIYAVAAELRARVRKATPERDYALMPLEALWWRDGEEGMCPRAGHDWRWSLLIRQPDFIAAGEAEVAIAAAGQDAGERAWDVRFGQIEEGRVMQTLHVGAYRDVWPAIQRLHDAIAAAGYAQAGRHHEIYLGDPRRTTPDRLRTILRQPVRRPAFSTAGTEPSGFPTPAP